jgi:hypothetical protein
MLALDFEPACASYTKVVSPPNFGIEKIQALLTVTSAWEVSETEFKKIWKEEYSSSMHKRSVRKHLNDDRTRFVMVMLSLKALTGDGVNRDSFTLYSLSRALNQNNAASMRNSLRNYLLVAMKTVGWIEWDKPGDHNRIVISDLGLQRVVDYIITLENALSALNN